MAAAPRGGGDRERRFQQSFARPLAGVHAPQPALLQASKMGAWARRALPLRFRYGGGVELRVDGPESARWQLSDGREIPRSFREVSEIRYQPTRASDPDNEDNIPPTNRRRPGGSLQPDIDESSTYIFSGRAAPKKKHRKARKNGPHEDEYGDDLL